MYQNPIQMLQQFNQFKQSFTGDPKAEIDRLIRSGQITQAELNSAQAQAHQFMQLLNTVATR